MKLTSFIKSIALASLIVGSAAVFSSCEKNNAKEEGIADAITVKGVVTDTSDSPVEGVTVSIKSGLSDEAAATCTSASDGSFSVEVSMAKAKFAVFEKEGYSSVSETIQSNKIKDGVIELHPQMEFAGGKITGRVLNASNEPLEGVSISTGAKTATSGFDGKFEITGLTISDYTLTFSATGCETVTKQVLASAFNADYVAELTEDIVLGGVKILPGKTLADLKATPAWYINEFRAGFGLGHTPETEPDYQYGNATTALMSAQFPSWYGRTEFQNEGCTLRIMSGEDANSGYVKDLEHFDSYTWGLKKITADNKILSVYWRTHNGSADNQVPWGVMVVDINASDPKAVSIADMDNNKTITYGTDSDWHTTGFDLGAYEGKEVVVAIGLYRNYDGKCDYQLPLTHISFGPAKVDGHKALGLYGTPVTGLEGWRMSLEEVKSMMPNPRKQFNGKKGDLVWEPNPCFGVWAGTGHIASEWGLQPVRHNYCTSSCVEGFMVDTRDLTADLSTPVSYFYSKFSIDSDHDKMSFYTRNFSSSTYTYFKVTVIEEDGTVSYLDPSANTASKAEKAESGCWKFIHENGWSEDLASCAKFDYDLSGFSGKDVVICIGLFSNGSDEQKMVFCSIKFE